MHQVLMGSEESRDTEDPKVFLDHKEKKETG